MPQSPTSDAAAPQTRAIAFYLPQFHPIPENDAWWGKGFTEWTNVVAAKPRFKGHYQPHLPGALGFYDLRLQESRLAQAALAAQYGIHGFCYYHYWFSGRRLLGRPLDDVLASGTPDLPFCLCWANESWSRTWSGRDHEALIRQEYSDADHKAHIAWLAQVFSDRRYILIDGRPVFLIYRPENIPDLARVVGEWKSYCVDKLSVEPFFCAVMTGFSTVDGPALLACGFDAIVDFQPNRTCFPAASSAAGRAVSLARKLLPATWYDALRDNRLLGKQPLNNVIEYQDYVAGWLAREYDTQATTFPCVFPSWDNTPRRAAATIIENHSAATYQRWLEAALGRVQACSADSRIVFINAWNEWAEGCHLEPDQKNGFAFLEATSASLQRQADGVIKRSTAPL